MRNRALTILGIFLLVSVGSESMSADIYRWTDENGEVHYSDRPARDRVSESVEVRVNTYESVSYATSSLEGPKKSSCIRPVGVAPVRKRSGTSMRMTYSTRSMMLKRAKKAGPIIGD